MKHTGYIFFAVLIFLLIFSYMSLESLIYTKQNLVLTNFKINRENNVRIAQKILKNLEIQLTTIKFLCPIKVTPAFKLADMPILWWKQYGCEGQFKNKKYYYVIESLGVDSCGILKKNKYNDKSLAEYSRVTLYMLNDQTSLSNIILQSTIVKSSEGNLPCHHSLHAVNVGKQMWREIN